jgi:hypothetical protein
MALVTENWSDRFYARGLRARRGWIVTPEGGDVSNEDEAWAAVGADAEPGAQFPQDSRLRILEQPAVTRERGALTFHVVAEYRPGDTTPVSGDEKLTRKPRFLWRSGNVTEPVDIDADDVPILNSAGQPFGNELYRTFGTRFLTITRWFTDYDVQMAVEYENAANSDTVTLPKTGGLTVDPGQMLCHTIEPTHEYDEDTDLVQVAFSFELRRGNVQDADGRWDGFKFRVADRGYGGWYDDSGLKPGNFINAQGERVSEPVLLDGTGKPIDAGFKVEGNKTPASYQTLADYLVEDTGTAVFLKYYKTRFLPFSALGIFA